MLDNIEEIAIAYLTQKSRYLNGLVANPFVVKKGRKFVCGIIDGLHNPIFLHGLHKYIRWDKYDNMFKYFKYFVDYLDFEHLKRIIYRTNTPEKYITLLMKKYPEKYADIFFEFFYVFRSDRSYFSDSRILDISTSIGHDKLYNAVGMARFDILTDIKRLLESHIKTRGAASKPKNIDPWFNNELDYVKKYGDLSDIERYIEFLKEAQKRYRRLNHY